MAVTLGSRPEHGFDEPLGLLSDCHRRIERFLGILETVVARAAGQPLNDEQRRAVEAALEYFRTAAPRHTADEEESLFPLLRASNSPGAAAALRTVQTLEDEHAAANVAHAEVESWYRHWIELGSLSDQQTQALSRVLQSLREMYRRHIEVEDHEIFPLAGRVLGGEQLAQLGKQMAERRGLHLAPVGGARPPQGPSQNGRGPNVARLPAPPAQQRGATTVITKDTIDVRTIPGPQRHPFIFRTFETLQPGEALELVNDHDPFPLQNQFNFMKRGQFSWDYLQEGPDLWRVRIGKVAPASSK
jgi:uncharacterized protein (DUF2249 family)/hemerythrin-like domain-containing protein